VPGYKTDNFIKADETHKDSKGKIAVKSIVKITAINQRDKSF
jgi:hypothetical protein